MEYYDDEEEFESDLEQDDIGLEDDEDKGIDLRCQQICDLYNRVILSYQKGSLPIYTPNVMTNVTQTDFLCYLLRK